MSKVKMIKKDAVIKVSIGVGFLKKIQEALIEVSSNYTPEQLETFKKLIEKNETLSEPWMETLLTLSYLIKAIEEEANIQGFIYEEEIS